MFRFARTFAKDPLRIVGILWPLALLAPFVPGLPRPSNGGLNWRQEATVALLLSLTFALLWRRALNSGRRGETDVQKPRASVRRGRVAARLELSLVVPLAAFVLWSAASTLWAANVFPATHYALSWAAYLLFFLSMRRAAESTRLLRASLGLLAVVVVVIGAANVIGYYGTPTSLIRQNGLGEPVAVSIPLFAALALCLRRRRAALLCGAAATLGWLSMLQIAERAPFFGVCLALALLAAFSLARTRFRPRTKRRAFALSAAFAACLALQTLPSPFAHSIRQPQTVLVRLKETGASDINTRARFLYWGAAFEMWRAHPLAGVGAGGYDGAFPDARASFAARRPDSPLVELNEKYLSSGAHNEYLQMLGELGVVGLAFFLAFGGALVWAAWRAWRHAASPLVHGAVASLVVFAVSSGASSVSFRWMGSGLMFFFAAALVQRFAAARPRRKEKAASARTRLAFRLTPAFARRGYALGLAASLLVLSSMCAQAVNVLLLADAQACAERTRAERLYRSALDWNPLDAATHYNYGIWLFFQKRERDAQPHLRYALARGFHTSTCYAYLAGAEANAGEAEAAERTLATGVRVYPRSVFLRVRHAAALERLGRAEEGELEMSSALLLNSRAARGWQQLIDNDIDAAIVAARRDYNVALPGQLQPEDGVFAVLEENEKRFPEAVSTGWRARIRSIRFQP
jgi:O-antigen ligase